MTQSSKSKVKLEIFDMDSGDPAKVKIKLTNLRNVLGVYRDNPWTADLDPGSYLVQISSPGFDRAIRGFNLLPGQILDLRLPIYPKGTMPSPPANLLEQPCRPGGVSLQSVRDELAAMLPAGEVDVRESTFTGKVLVDYKNADGFVFTTEMSLEDEPILEYNVGGVDVVTARACGNHQWVEYIF